jgi:hypothetical protein
VDTIVFVVGDVIDDVDSAGSKRKGHEGKQHTTHGRQVRQLVREHQGQKHQSVLAPLCRTHSDYGRLQLVYQAVSERRRCW